MDRQLANLNGRSDWQSRLELVKGICFGAALVCFVVLVCFLIAHANGTPKLLQLLRGDGRITIQSIEIDGQGRQAICGPKCVKQLNAAMSQAIAKHDLYRGWGNMFSGTVTLSNGSAAVCRVAPFANGKGIGFEVLEHAWDTEPWCFDVALPESAPSELKELAEFLADRSATGVRSF